MHQSRTNMKVVLLEGVTNIHRVKLDLMLSFDPDLTSDGGLSRYIFIHSASLVICSTIDSVSFFLIIIKRIHINYLCRYAIGYFIEDTLLEELILLILAESLLTGLFLGFLKLPKDIFFLKLGRCPGDDGGEEVGVSVGATKAESSSDVVVVVDGRGVIVLLLSSALRGVSSCCWTSSFIDVAASSMDFISDKIDRYFSSSSLDAASATAFISSWSISEREGSSDFCAVSIVGSSIRDLRGACGTSSCSTTALSLITEAVLFFGGCSSSVSSSSASTSVPASSALSPLPSSSSSSSLSSIVSMLDSLPDDERTNFVSATFSTTRS
mmetsp:Transcript_12/g.33  ORF Transcript_12/g.33 Transcript_12/m.33 type:complete len:325 (-) Transcript_12:328-1302(-)